MQKHEDRLGIAQAKLQKKERESARRKRALEVLASEPEKTEEGYGTMTYL